MFCPYFVCRYRAYMIGGRYQGSEISSFSSCDAKPSNPVCGWSPAPSHTSTCRQLGWRLHLPREVGLQEDLRLLQLRWLRAALEDVFGGLEPLEPEITSPLSSRSKYVDFPPPLRLLTCSLPFWWFSSAGTNSKGGDECDLWWILRCFFVLLKCIRSVSTGILTMYTRNWNWFLLTNFITMVFPVLHEASPWQSLD